MVLRCPGFVKLSEFSFECQAHGIDSCMWVSFVCCIDASFKFVYGVLWGYLPYFAFVGEAIEESELVSVIPFMNYF
jgi:hypothetical protein